MSPGGWAREPYFLVILFFDNPVVLGVMSYLQSAPVGMPMRVLLGAGKGLGR